MWVTWHKWINNNNNKTNMLATSFFKCIEWQTQTKSCMPLYIDWYEIGVYVENHQAAAAAAEGTNVAKRSFLRWHHTHTYVLYSTIYLNNKNLNLFCFYNWKKNETKSHRCVLEYMCKLFFSFVHRFSENILHQLEFLSRHAVWNNINGARRGVFLFYVCMCVTCDFI